MSKLSHKEREQLATIIDQENAMLKRVRRIIRWETILLVIFVILYIWGAYITNDAFLPNISPGLKVVFRWTGLIGTIVFVVLMILSFISYRNGRRGLLAKIDLYQGKEEK